MKTTRFGLGVFLVLAATSGIFAQENTFGLRAGSFQFPESEIFTESMFIERPAQHSGGPIQTKLFWQRAFETEEYSGTLWEFYYTFRRDTDAHFQMDLSAGLFSRDATHVNPGLAIVKDAGDFNNNGITDEEVTASVASTLEYTLYYVHLTPTYQFTTGKFRFYVGGGLGLWANFWREVVDATFPDIFTCADNINFTGCAGQVQLRESTGNRRTIIPISASAGFVYQFLPHWSLNLEDRYLFNADSSVNLFREESDYSISGNQILIGISYRL